ncbi:MAG: MOSC N-terminal beta barrel domain-containing protein [Betaproteobacteria bacterium]
MPRARISALNVYPIKGCRGIALPRARVAERGLTTAGPSAVAGDREWMIVDADGRFVTQREYPQLALIATSLAAGALVLASPGMPSLCLPFEIPGLTLREVVVWNSQVTAHDAGDAAARWLSSAIGDDLRLVRFDPAGLRLCNPQYAGDSGAHTAFADGYPVLVIGEGSLNELNARLAAKGIVALPMNRFRPNVVLAGLDPFDEDHVDTISVDGVTLKLVKPCTRCQVTTTDQASAAVGTEPLATLAGFRMNTVLSGVTFGMNAIVVGGVGRELSVGADADCRFAF